jgi:hypothetical protein
MQDSVLVPMLHSLCHIQHPSPQHHINVHYVAIGAARICFKMGERENLLMFKSFNNIFMDHPRRFMLEKTNIFKK